LSGWSSAGEIVRDIPHEIVREAAARIQRADGRKSGADTRHFKAAEVPEAKIVRNVADEIVRWLTDKI
jgi:hypothetical protein